MKLDALNPRSGEIELKLAVPTSDPASLAKRLAKTPVLARRKALHQNLHNVYYDTPQQTLRQKRVALRIRRIGSEAKSQWLQTLKIGGNGDSALSQRGEWEYPVPSAVLDTASLEATPWSGIDPDGAVFQALAPCFVTSFERTSWLVRRRDGSVVEVALDIGQIVAGDKHAPICELEFELKAGKPEALFELAQQIAQTIAVLPLAISKSGRGYALAQDGLDTPLRAQPPKLRSKLPLPVVARSVLGEMFCQFTTNLHALLSSDDPEVVHQARVGWRRFRSALRLFKPVFAEGELPTWQVLKRLLKVLGELRDLDVAHTDTLPPLADAYIAGDDKRAAAWRSMNQTLIDAAQLQRKAIRSALQEPAVGVSLLSTTQWLELAPPLSERNEEGLKQDETLRHWASRRVARLYKLFKLAVKDTASAVTVDDVNLQHQTRIAAKQMRYGIEALDSMLQKKRSQRWLEQAIRLQTRIGTSRDMVQANAIAAKLEADRELVSFLRGVAAGRIKPR